MRPCTLRYKFADCDNIMEGVNKGMYGSGFLSSMDIMNVLDNNSIYQGEIVKKEDNVYIIHLCDKCPINAIRYNENSGFAKVMNDEIKSISEYNGKIKITGFKKWDSKFESQIKIKYNNSVAKVMSFGYYSEIHKEIICNKSLEFKIGSNNFVISGVSKNSLTLDHVDSNIEVNIIRRDKNNKLNLDGMCVHLGSNKKIDNIEVSSI